MLLLCIVSTQNACHETMTVKVSMYLCIGELAKLGNPDPFHRRAAIETLFRLCKQHTARREKVNKNVDHLSNKYLLMYIFR